MFENKQKKQKKRIKDIINLSFINNTDWLFICIPSSYKQYKFIV